jgi:uncharacterized membrane protein YdcZ (DUF606 family)
VLVGAVGIAVISGALTSVQTRINSQLASELGDPFVAALVSFGSGLLILTIIVLAAPTGRHGIQRLSRSVRARETPWFFLIGGAFGALFVIGQGLTAAIIGVLVIMVILLAVLGLVVVNALAESPWGVFSIAMTIPIAIFMGLYLRYLRPGRVSEVSLIGVALLLLAVVAGGWIDHTDWGAEWFTLSKVTLACA